MKPLGYYSSLPSDSDVFDELMLRYGVTLEKVNDGIKCRILSDLGDHFWFSADEDTPDDITEMYSRLSEDGKLALIEAVAVQLRESKRQQRQVACQVAVAAKNEIF